eukprot:4544760-Lingulodinium_polyedra.AAC.1
MRELTVGYDRSMRGPIFGPFAECASVRFASRCGGDASTRPRCCAVVAKRCAMTRSKRRFAAAAAQTPH